MSETRSPAADIPTHQIPSQCDRSPTQSSSNSVQPKIKVNNGMDKIKHSLLNNWIESGFIENVRGQIRCQLISELKHPFHHKHSKRTNHLSLDRRILNSIVIDYLTKYGYNYSLSVFKSEIGGELIGSISVGDTRSQLRLDSNKDTAKERCFMEQLVDTHKMNADISRQNTLNTFHQKNLEWELSAVKNDAKMQTEALLKKERIAVQELQQQLEQQLKLHKMDESSKFSTLHSDLESANKTIFSLKEELRRIQEQQQNDLSMRSMENQWKDKYTEIHQELMETLNRENELQCLLDEESIKLKSAKREVNYLETLIADQGTLGNTQKIKSKNGLNPKSLDHIEHSEDIKVRVQSSVSTIPQIIETDPMQPVYDENENSENRRKEIGIKAVEIGGNQRNQSIDSSAKSLTSHSRKEHLKMQKPQSKVHVHSNSSNAINHQFARKYEELELDLKKRLRVQAMLETDSRKLTNHTKHFFDQLNQQKNETSQILHKLQSVQCTVQEMPKLETKSHFNVPSQPSHSRNSIGNDSHSPSTTLISEKKKNRQSLIEYTLNRLRNERNEQQQQIRMDIHSKMDGIHGINKMNGMKRGPPPLSVNPESETLLTSDPKISGQSSVLKLTARDSVPYNTQSEDVGDVDDGNNGTGDLPIDLSESVCIGQQESMQSTDEYFEDVVKIDIDSPSMIQTIECIENTQRLSRHSETTSPVSVAGNVVQKDDAVHSVDDVVSTEMISDINAGDGGSSDDQDSNENDPKQEMEEEQKREILIEIEKEETKRSDVMDEEERERLERERLEQDLMEDYTQSESFSGVGFLQNDFLEQYQKHIESISEQ